MRTVCISLLLAGSVVATAAPAQEADTNPAFTGPRVEGTIGYDHLGAGSSVDNDNGRDDQNIDGFLYGGGVGFDFAAGGALLGVEGELTDSTAKSKRYDYTSGFGFGRVDAGRDWYVGARAGILANPSTLLYVKGGYTNLKLNVLAGNTNNTTDTNFKLDGWRLGAGAERAIGKNTYAKIEYRYSNYERGDINYGIGGNSGRFDVDTDRHQVVASYGIRF